MSLAVAAALAALAAASAGDLRVELGGRAEGRTSTVAVKSLPPTTRGQLDLIPRGALALDAGSLGLSAAYQPSLRVSATPTAARADLLHDATLRGVLRGERLTLDATAVAVRGVTDPLVDPLAGRALPTITPVPYLGGRAGIGAVYLLGPRTTAAAGASASIEGGADAAARDALPLQRALALTASLDRLATPRDALRLGVGASAARTGPEARAAWARATATWRHLLSPRLTARAGGGVAVLDNVEPGRPAGVFQSAPLAELGVAYAPEDGMRTEDLVVRVTPAFDRLTGAARSQLEAVATARWRVAPAWTLAADTSGAVAWQGPDVWFGGGSVALRRATGSGPAIELGLRGRWYLDRSPEVPSSLEVSSFVAVALDLAARPPSGAPARSP